MLPKTSVLLLDNLVFFAKGKHEKDNSCYRSGNLCSRASEKVNVSILWHKTNFLVEFVSL